MRIEKEGFVLHLEGTWCEISNKYAVLQKRNWIAISKHTRSEDMVRLTDA